MVRFRFTRKRVPHMDDRNRATGFAVSDASAYEWSANVESIVDKKQRSLR